MNSNFSMYTFDTSFTPSASSSFSSQSSTYDSDLYGGSAVWNQCLNPQPTLYSQVPLSRTQSLPAMQLSQPLQRQISLPQLYSLERELFEGAQTFRNPFPQQSQPVIDAWSHLWSDLQPSYSSSSWSGVTQPQQTQQRMYDLNSNGQYFPQHHNMPSLVEGLTQRQASGPVRRSPRVLRKNNGPYRNAQQSTASFDSSHIPTIPTTLSAPPSLPHDTRQKPAQHSDYDPMLPISCRILSHDPTHPDAGIMCDVGPCKNESDFSQHLLKVHGIHNNKNDQIRSYCRWNGVRKCKSWSEGLSSTGGLHRHILEVHLGKPRTSGKRNKNTGEGQTVTLTGPSKRGRKPKSEPAAAYPVNEELGYYKKRI